MYCGNNPVNRWDPLGLFDYNTVLSYNPNAYNEDVVALQNELAYHGYLSSNDRGGINLYYEKHGGWFPLVVL